MDQQELVRTLVLTEGIHLRNEIHKNELEELEKELGLLLEEEINQESVSICGNLCWFSFNK